jgi:hypothetical protein
MAEAQAAFAQVCNPTCDNGVPVGHTACNPGLNPNVEYVCVDPSQPSAQQWTPRPCPSGQTCVGDHCQGGSVPMCGYGLFCAGSAIAGASACSNGYQTVYCCPSGQTIVDGACAASGPPPCGYGLYCALGAMAGASQCTSGAQTLYCCPYGQTIVNGACSG